MRILDRKILLSYVLVLLCGILIGYDITSSNKELTNLPAWLSAFGTLVAVAVALYSNRINVERDTYKLQCSSQCETYSMKAVSLDNPFIEEKVWDFRIRVKAVNIGLRPIAIDCLRVINSKNVTIDLPEITKKHGPNGLLESTVVTPGDFNVWEVPKTLYVDKDGEIQDISVWIVDALGVAHKAYPN